MTQTQKILAAHAGKSEVHAGELIMADVDLVLGNDITAPVAIGEFAGFGREKVFDRTKIALVPDHFTPNKDVRRRRLLAWGGFLSYVSATLVALALYWGKKNR